MVSRHRTIGDDSRAASTGVDTGKAGGVGLSEEAAD